MNEHEELSRQVRKLVALLKKMSQGPVGQGGPAALPPELAQILGDAQKNIQLNLCFFAFMPMDPEDMVEMEEMMEGELAPPQMAEKDALAFEITPADQEFLKQHGIKF